MVLGDAGDDNDSIACAAGDLNGRVRLTFAGAVHAGDRARGPAFALITKPKTNERLTILRVVQRSPSL